ncbi:asparagine synthase (glutamine-hydrolyzing) [Tellurirhabdus bombi]|uniref:asparagine synthase (glutamine-hydrolyzing) n=1 Tax=Tellurirhabdus bombi TaxID=2907205 RepID=UPI001F1A556F|nr:asparagine synthase (glutamine-hydrolyzing) [Tellurirhabdus bombi]
MCGIAGIVHFSGSPVQSTDIKAMMERQRHRGPDDGGLFLDQNVGLGFVRLSILDLSPAGHQPMQSDDERYVLIFNGEIYNYLEIKARLSAHYTFRSQTDTEVLLNAYRHWGADCLHHLNGMFAFAIHDRHDRKLFAARDRFGVKPFYYYLSDSCFVFASEIPPIFEHVRAQGHPLQPDETVMFNYLIHNRTDLNNDTFVQQIKKLGHGHCLTIQDNKLQINRWYNLTERLQQGWENPEEYYNCFQSSVDLRLRSDVPVGICLSGGLDSSSVASTLISGLNKKDFYAFSAVYGAGLNGDESSFINEYQNQLPNLVYVRPTEESLLDDFDSLMNCHFEPFGGLSIYSQFKVMKDAAQYVKVLMDGQGADEQLGGYMYFFGSFFRELLATGQYRRFAHEWRQHYKNHRTFSGLSYLAFYAAPAVLKDAMTNRKAGFVHPDFYREQQSKSTINAQLFSPKTLRESLLQHFESKLEHNLKWNDLNSMYFSIELREPFLDYRLVERTLASSSEQLIKDGTTKWILREAMRNRLPEKIRTRQDKVGFENPADHWMRASLFQQKAEEALHSPALVASGYFDVAQCRRRLKLHREGKIAIARDIWKWIETAHFLNKFTASPAERLSSGEANSSSSWKVQQKSAW